MNDCRSRITAPRPGMNSGAVAGTPYRIKAATWPISWM